MDHQQPIPFFGKSETSALARSIDWSTHPLGPAETWDPSLKTSISLAMSSKFPMFVAWGKEKYLFYNDAYALILGGKHPAAFGNRFQDVWAEIWNDLIPLIGSVENDEAVYLEDLWLIMNRKGFDEETYFTFSYSPIYATSGSIEGLFCAVVETTDRVFTERALKSREAEVVNVLDGMSDGFFTLDGNWIIKRINKQFERITKTLRNEVVGKSLVDVFFHTPELRDSLYMKMYTRVMTERIPGSLVDHYEPLNIWTSVSAFPTEDGGIAVFFREISEERKAAKTLQDAIKSRDEFISIASHELKTPLTTLKLKAEMILRYKNQYSEEKLQTNYEKIIQQVNRLDRLVEDMLDISRLNTGRLTIQRTQSDMVQICREVIEHMDDAFKHVTGQSITFQSIESAPVLVDRLRIEQVVSNVLQNALKYGNAKPVSLSLESGEGTVTLRITDQGIGIDGALQTKIFDRFERAISANEISGLGLGLYIARQIMTAHDGDIRVESQVGEGSTFVITLPLL